MTIGEPSPTARALQALELLQSRPGITAEQLGERLGVTERAARRYVAILRETGIRVESTRGRHGGYRIGHGRRPPPLVFTAAEALGLVMAVLDGQHAAADRDDPVGAALGKLIGALPGAVARPAATLRAHALAVPARAARPDPAITSDLVEAVAARRPVTVGYRSASGRSFGVEVEPWAVLVRYGRWYLLGLARPADAVRTLRVDRIESVTTLDGTFVPPDDLDPVAFFQEHLGSSWAHETRVLFDAPYAAVAPRVTAPMGRLEPVEGGARCRLVGSTNDPEVYVGERLATLPFPFTVEGGPELRAAVAAAAERFAAAVQET